MRPGERIGDYTIVSRIGEGGMSIVYLAEHTTDRKRVVVKELKEQHRFNPQLVDRFLREATILQSLRHPHLARVFDVLQHDGKEYIIQEHLPGGSLADLLREKKDYSEQEAIRWCCDALRAMNYAHENGIVHRDLKPSNLMLDDQREVRVIDFGIARAFGQERLTRTGDGSIGTLEYMSPEQILTPQHIDHQTDVYSMGIVLYELLSGSVPFDGPTPFSIQEKIARQPPPPLRQLGQGVVPLHPNGGGINPKLSRIVFRAIEKRPENRFGGCAEFALYLERHLTQQGVPSRTEAATRNAFLLVALGLVTVILAVAGWRLYPIAQTGETSQSKAAIDDQARAEPERRRIEEEQRAEAERQAQLQKQQEADRQAQLLKQKDADRQAQLLKQQEAERQAQLLKQQDADRQAQLLKQQEADRQAQLLKQQEADRQAQLLKQKEAERQAQLLKQTEAERQAQLLKQKEADRLKEEANRQAQIQKQQEADRQAQLLKQQEADRQAQLLKQKEADRRRLEQQQAAANLYRSVMGTWTREEDTNFGQSRTRTTEELNIGDTCSGVLTRTVTTYVRGFAGWKKDGDSQISEFRFRCDPAGRVSGELDTQLSVQDKALLLGASIFTRRR